MMVRNADHDSDIQLVAVAAWQEHHRREKGAEALGPVIDPALSKAYMTVVLSFTFEFQNMTMTPLVTIKEVFLMNFPMMRSN